MPSLDELLHPKGPGDPVSKPSTFSVKDAHLFGGKYDPELGGQTYDQDQSKYRFQLKNNADNDLLRAQDQGFWESLGITAANAIPNILTGMGEMVGYSGTLASEWGADRDYTNSLTDLMKKWHNPFGEVYKEHPNQTIDLGDSAWWMDNVGQLVESAAQFAIPAEGLALGLGKIGKGIAGLAKLAGMEGRMAETGGKILAHVGTGASLAYAEGAMSGYQIYDQVYQANFNKAIAAGMDGKQAHDHANKIASDAAATTVQMNVVMNTMLNMTALAPLFEHSENKALDFLRKYGAPQEGETGTKLASRLMKTAENEGLLKYRHGITSLASEAIQEGLEEVNTQYAEYEGRRQGLEGKTRSDLAALTDFGQALTDVTNQEGLLNFALGSLGGVAQTVLLDHLPFNQRKTQQADGTIKKEFVSARTLNNDGTHKYYTDITNAVARDVDYMNSKMKELKQYRDAGDTLNAERVRREMFDVLALNSVHMGTGENWINTFQKMAGTSNSVKETIARLNDQLQALDAHAQQLQANGGTPEQLAEVQKQKDDILAQIANPVTPAMQSGLAMHSSDDSYKERATQAVEDLKAYQKMYDEVRYKYNTAEEDALGVADYIFANKAGQYRLGKLIEHATKELERAKNENALSFVNIGGMSMNSAADQVSAKFVDAIRAHNARINRIKGDLEQLRNSKDPLVKEKILSKYKMVGYVGADQVSKLVANMQKQVDSASKGMQEETDALKESVPYQQWEKKNPGKSVNDFINDIQKKYGSAEHLINLESDLASMRDIYNDNARRLTYIGDDRAGANELVKKLKPAIERRNTAIIEEYRNQEASKAAEKASDQAHVDATIKELGTQERDARKRLQQHQATLSDLFSREEQLVDKIRKTNVTSATHWRMPWQPGVQKLQSQLDDVRKQIHHTAAGIQFERESIQSILNSKQKVTQDGNIDQAPKPAQETGKAATTEPTPEQPTPTTPTPGPATAGSDAAAPDGTAPQEGKPNVEPARTDRQMNLAIKYSNNLERLPAEVHGAFQSLENDLKAGMPLDIDAFMARPDIQAAIQQGLVWNRGIANVAQMLNEYVQSLPDTVRPQQAESQEDADVPDDGEGTAEEKKVDPVEIPPDQPPTNSSADVVDQGDGAHVGKKLINATTVAQNSLLYVDFKDLNGNWRMAGKQLNPNVPEDILTPGQLEAGTELRLMLDTEYNDQNRDYGVPNSQYAQNKKIVRYSDFVNAEGIVTDIDNVPIKIVDEKGTVVGYLHTIPWVTETYAPGTSGKERYRNIVPEIEIQKPDGTTAIVDNLSKQVNELRALRRKVVNVKQLGTIVSSKSPGTLILNKVEGSDGIWRTERGPALSVARPGESLLPHADFLGIIQGGQVMHKKNVPIKVENDDLAAYENAPVVILPTAAEGKNLVSPLYMPKLDDALSHNTVIRAIELYLESGNPESKAELDKVFELTGYDLTDHKDLRRFITSQFTYLQSFNGANTALDPTKSEKFMINITDPQEGGKASIMIGRSSSGQKPVFAKTVNGKLTSQFADALKAGLATRYRNVNFTTENTRGINSSGSFKELLYGTSGWKAVEHESYNKYVLKQAQTYVYGRNTLKNGQPTYVANPVIELGEVYKPIIPSGEIQTTEVKEDSPNQEIGSEEAAEMAAMLGIKLNSPVHIASVVQPAEDLRTPLSREVLEEMYNFTPPGKRNGVTVDEALQDMMARGLAYVAEGYNPFIKC